MATKAQIETITANAQTEKLKQQFAANLKEIEGNVANMSMDKKLESLNIIRSSAVTEVPRNSEELWHYVKAVYGKELAYTATDPEFNSPFEYYSKMWFSREEKVVALASRGGGKTDLASIFINMAGTLRPNYEIVHAAGTKVQASVLADYIQNFYQDPVLKPFFDGIPARESFKWKNYARAKVATGTMRGVSGQHSNIITLDEIEFWKPEDIQQTLEVPVAKNGYQRGWSAFSTRQRNYGGMAWLVDNAAKRGIAVFKWSAFETMQPCKRCLGYNSPVLLADGTTVPIGKLVNQKLNVEVKCFDKETQTFVNRKVTDWVKLPVKDSKWYRLGLKTSVSRTIGSVQNPYGIWITGDHKIPTERGDIEVQDLEESDRILTTYTKPNSIQQQMIDGMMLGDAHLQKPRVKKDNSRFSTTHTEAHGSYIDATAKALNGLTLGVYDSPQHKQTKPSRSVQTGASPYWTEQRDRWYNKGVKIVPEDLVLTPLVLATWYMDDGSIQVTHDKFRQISLHTQGFGSTSFWRLFYKLVEIGFKPTATVGDTTGMVIKLGESNGDVDRFLKLVSPYILPCFRYKVVGKYLNYDATLWDMGVAGPYYSQFEVMQGTPGKHHHPETVFCIEVEEHHNFVVNKMVVNNCIAIDAHPNYRGEATDKAREEVCILWKACRGERAKKATGWYPLSEIQDKCLRLGGPDGREWHTQGLCDRPSNHGLVLFNFDHVNRPDGNYTRHRYAPELPWYATHDPAEGKKSVIYFIQVHEGKSYVFDERILSECPDVTAAKQDFYEHCVRNGYGDPDIIVVDPHRTDAVATWKMGTPNGSGITRKYNADTPDISETTGTGQLLFKTLDYLREYICNGKGERSLFVNPEMCPGCIKGISEHHYPTDMNNNILSNKPDEAYKDEVDPLRYWVMYLRTKFGSRTGRIIIF